MINDNINTLRNLFIIRDDVYSVQQKSSKYFTNRSPIDNNVLENHIRGLQTIGVYTLSEDSKCKWVCYDFDETDIGVANNKAIALSKTIKDRGYENFIEFSGMKGYHVWIFFNEIDSISAYNFGKKICNGHMVKEMFPKQDKQHTKKKLGNLVKLPLGLHQVSGNRSYFLDPVTYEPLTHDESFNLLYEISNKDKSNIPKDINVVKEEKVKMVVSSSKEDISDLVNAIIEHGAKIGDRHKKAWFIAVDLYFSGWDKEEIIKKVLLFNKNCDLPKDEDVVKTHIENIFKNTKDYIEKYGYIKDRSIESDLKWIMKKERERIEYNKDVDKSDRINFDQKLFNYVVSQAFIKNCYFKTTKDNDELYIYNKENGIYERSGSEFINTTCENYLNKYANINVKSEVVAHIKHTTYIHRDEFNADKNKICLSNGILDLTTLEMEEFSPEKMFTVSLPVKYDIEAKCEEFEALLKEKMICQEDIDTIQEYFGFCLLNDMRFQRALLLYGVKRGSKSTVLSVLEEMLGSDNVSNMTLQFLNMNNFAVANLYGKKANICADLPLEALRSISQFMLITGEDSVNGDVKNSKIIKFKNIANPVFSCNQIPRIPDYEPAFFRRWILLEFPIGTPPEKCDEKLGKRLITEENISGVLNWALVGLKRLLSNHHFSYRYDEESIIDLWRKNSDTISSYVFNSIEIDDNGKVKVREIYDNYVKYCEDGNMRSETIQKFSRVIKQETGATDKKIGNSKGYAGIRFKDDDDIPDVPTEEQRKLT